MDQDAAESTPHLALSRSYGIRKPRCGERSSVPRGSGADGSGRCGPLAQDRTHEGQDVDPVMQSMAEARPADVGMPGDNSEDRYPFYLESADCGDATRQLVEEFLPQHHAVRIAKLACGFELEMH
jgi:hypothetical protein